MPALATRGRSRRRAMNEINMVPFIDVMLVLLIIFMVTAPLITTGVVDLPSVGRSAQRPPTVIEVLVDAEGRLKMRVADGDATPVTLGQLPDRVRQAQEGRSDVPVVISGDRNVRYDAVMKVMAVLQKERLPRVGLSVRQADG